MPGIRVGGEINKEPAIVLSTAGHGISGIFVPVLFERFA
jgi:hypothetical protein